MSSSLEHDEFSDWYSGSAFNFAKMPRYIGYPHQVRVTRKANMFRLFDMWEEMRYCIFVSIYVIYPGKRVIVDKIFIDFDDAEKPEHALTDLRKVIRWSNQKGYQTEGLFTGGKGYHGHILLKPKSFNIRDVEDASLLKQKLRAILNWIAAQGWLWRFDEEGKLDHDYGRSSVKPLRTVDERIRGDYKRIARVPGFRYVKFKNNQYFPKETYSLSLSNDILLNTSHDQITEYCSEHRSYRPVLDLDSRLLDLDEFMEENNIRIKDWLSLGGFGSPEYAEYDGNYAHPNAEIIKGIFPKACIHQDLLGCDEPRHLTRFYVAVMLLNFYKWHPKKVIEFFRNLNLADFSEDETTIQVWQIANHVPPYIPASCRILKQWGLCVREKCGDYRKTYEG